jgi:hypothetical protein
MLGRNQMLSPGWILTSAALSVPTVIRVMTIEYINLLNIFLISSFKTGLLDQEINALSLLSVSGWNGVPIKKPQPCRSKAGVFFVLTKYLA